MTIELTRELRAQAIASIERYFLEDRGEKLGNVAAGALLGYFLEPFAYWRKFDKVKKPR